MRLRILRSALEDLAAAREFYERQAEGIGDYFFDSLFTEIDSLTLFMPGFIPSDSDTTASW